MRDRWASDRSVDRCSFVAVPRYSEMGDGRGAVAVIETVRGKIKRGLRRSRAPATLPSGTEYLDRSIYAITNFFMKWPVLSVIPLYQCGDCVVSSFPLGFSLLSLPLPWLLVQRCF